MKHLVWLIFWCSIFIIHTLHAEISVPELKGRVNDCAGVLSAREEEELSKRLQLLESETGAQVVILTINSTFSEEIEEFSMRVVEEWKLGQKDIDNGVLLLAAIQDRKFRIEVGYGLEGDLTDGYCKLLIVNTIAPAFKQGFYYDGYVLVITDFYTKILTVETDEENVPQEDSIDYSDAEDGKATLEKNRENRKKGDLIATVIVVLLMALPFARLIKSKKVKQILLGCFGMGTLILTGSFIISGLLLLLSFVALFATNINGITRNRRGGFGGGIGGSGFGGFGGGGGFSGGGGGFGGGGASGGW